MKNKTKTSLTIEKKFNNVYTRQVQCNSRQYKSFDRVLFSTNYVAVTGVSWRGGHRAITSSQTLKGYLSQTVQTVSLKLCSMCQESGK